VSQIHCTFVLVYIVISVYILYYVQLHEKIISSATKGVGTGAKVFPLIRYILFVHSVVNANVFVLTMPLQEW